MLPQGMATNMPGSDDIGFMASDGLGRAGGYSLLLSALPQENIGKNYRTG